jgi:hypothetical protein
MDDMKKGLVMPKETLLQFSRTYARIFADPESLAYASSGVNARIQRLSTAWTNFSQKLYAESKGGIKGGLAIATDALIALTKHIDDLALITKVLGTAIGVAFVKHLGQAIIRLVAYKAALIGAADAQLLFTNRAALLAGTTTLANLGLAQAGFFAGLSKIFATIPKWTLVTAAIGSTVLVLKDAEIGTIRVASEFEKLTESINEYEQQLTLGGFLSRNLDKMWEGLKAIGSSIGT